MNRPPRIAVLDIYRSLAILSVALFHYGIKYFEFNPNSIHKSLNIFKHGHYGVSFFFVISGFVILMSLEKVKGIKDFYKRRFIRLFPAFWISVLLTSLSMNVFLADHEITAGLLDTLLNLTMMPSLLKVKLVDGVYWSLLVELLFYFLISSILLMRYEFLVRVKVFIIVWFFCSILSRVLFNSLAPIFCSSYMHFFVLGITSYLNYTNRSSLFTFFSLFLIYCYSYFFQPFNDIVLLAIFHILFNKRLLQYRVQSKLLLAFVSIGKISYVYYLIHQNIGFLALKCLERISDSLYLNIALVILLGLFISYFMESFVVKKFTRFVSNLLHA